MLAHQPSETAPQCQPGDSCRCNHTTRRGEAMQLGRTVEFAPGRAALSAHCAMLRIDVDALHPRQVDHQATIPRRVSRDVVTATAHRDLDPSTARKVNRIDDIGGSKAAGDQPRPFVDQSIVDPSRVLVPGISRKQQPAGETGRQFAELSRSIIDASGIRQLIDESKFDADLCATAWCGSVTRSFGRREFALSVNTNEYV